MMCCELSAGKLRNRINIERNQPVDDGQGGSTKQWLVLKSVKAYIKPTSGTEPIRQMRPEATLTHKIYIRYFLGLAPDDRINFNGRYMNIVAMVNMEERNRWYELSCEEGVAQ